MRHTANQAPGARDKLGGGSSQALLTSGCNEPRFFFCFFLHYISPERPYAVNLQSCHGSKQQDLLVCVCVARSMRRALHFKLRHEHTQPAKRSVFTHVAATLNKSVGWTWTCKQASRASNALSDPCRCTTCSYHFSLNPAGHCRSCACKMRTASNERKSTGMVQFLSRLRAADANQLEAAA